MKHIIITSVICIGLLPGCVVSHSEHREVKDALALEQAAHRHTSSRAYDLQLELAKAQHELDSRDGKLAQRNKLLEEAEKLLAQSELDLAVASKERESASALVDQLREELSRVGGHLRVFSDQKEELKDALTRAEARVEHLARIEKDAARRAVIVRDLALSLHDVVNAGSVTVALEEGDPVLSLASDKVFVDQTLRPEARRVLDALARVVATFEDLNIEISERDGNPNAEQAKRLERLERVADALADDGIAPGRVSVQASDAASPVSDEASETSEEDAKPAPNPRVLIAIRG